MEHTSVTKLPDGIYAPGRLFGGTSATTVVGTWTAVSDGEFTVSIDGTSYDLTAIDFSSGVTTMANVASKIQTALRAATSSTETVVWDTDHFEITSANTTSTSAVTVTSAVSGGSGTDISGAGGTAFMDADVGAAAEIVEATSQNEQILTATYATLDGQVDTNGMTQISVKPVYTPATSETRTLTMLVQVSDQTVDVTEANSTWHALGSQDNVDGALTEEGSGYEYADENSAEHPFIPYTVPILAKKMRLRVKEDGTGKFGFVRATVAMKHEA